MASSSERKPNTSRQFGAVPQNKEATDQTDVKQYGQSQVNNKKKIITKIWRTTPSHPYVVSPQNLPATPWGSVSSLRRSKRTSTVVCQNTVPPKTPLTTKHRRQPSTLNATETPKTEGNTKTITTTTTTKDERERRKTRGLQW